MINNLNHEDLWPDLNTTDAKAEVWYETSAFADKAYGTPLTTGEAKAIKTGFWCGYMAAARDLRTLIKERADEALALQSDSESR